MVKTWKRLNLDCLQLQPFTNYTKSWNTDNLMAATFILNIPMNLLYITCFFSQTVTHIYDLSPAPPKC